MLQTCLALLEIVPSMVVVTAVHKVSSKVQQMSLGTAVSEQGQSTYNSVLLTLHLKYQIKPIQLGTHQVGKLCASLLQSHASKAN